MPAVNVNGCNIYYEIHGKGNPLVMIMGLRRNIEWWYRQIPALSQHFQVIAFDNRGAGRSDKPEMDYSIRLFADDTAALMDALEIDRAHILGISMGGYIAQELAINYPQKVLDLVLGCTSAGGATAVSMSAERQKKFTANEGLTPEQILQKDMDIFFSDAFVKNNPAAVEEFKVISMRYYQPAHAFERQFAACMKHDTGARLDQVRQPALIMTGDDDPLVPPQNSMILKELLPNSKLSIFPKGRHIFCVEFADRFNREVIDFFKPSS
ncbi:MAG: alpha/beta fold hydrolase [Candidatus Zixiibacteriota bacterium]|nr:MAG: alpha/beta fold hydrolase [candidate division Zixibacteria bacterium]